MFVLKKCLLYFFVNSSPHVQLTPHSSVLSSRVPPCSLGSVQEDSFFDSSECKIAYYGKIYDGIFVSNMFQKVSCCFCHCHHGGSVAQFQ